MEWPPSVWHAEEAIIDWPPGVWHAEEAIITGRLIEYNQQYKNMVNWSLMPDLQVDTGYNPQT